MYLEFEPFLSRMIGKKKELHKAVEKFYKKNELEYYSLACKSKFYNHHLLCSGSLESEIASKRFLGIFLYTGKFPESEIKTELYNLLKKSFRKLYNYFGKNREFDINDFCKVDEDELVLALYFVLNSGGKIKISEPLQTIFQLLFAELQPSIEDVPATESYVKNFKKIVGFTTLKEFLYETYESLESIELIMDLNNIDTEVLFDETAKDIEVVSYCYERAINEDKDKLFALSLCYINQLAKNFKNVKQEYFKNNTETVLQDIQLLEQENARLKAESKSLLSEIASRNQETKQLARQIESCEINNNELNSLRELMFSLQEELKVDETQNGTTPLCKNAKAVVIGGHDTVQRRIKSVFANFEFVSAELDCFDSRILDKAQAVFVLTEHIGHGLYYFAMRQIKNRDIPVFYLRGQNKSRLVADITKTFKKTIGDKNGNL